LVAVALRAIPLIGVEIAKRTNVAVMEKKRIFASKNAGVSVGQEED
jgi:hypothetical protein